MTLTVSTHALIRWLERVEMVDFASATRGIPSVPRWRIDRLKLDHAERVIDLDAIRTKILSPTVIEAWRAGAHTVVSRKVRILFEGNVVVSIVPLRTHRKPRNCKQEARPESVQPRARLLPRKCDQHSISARIDDRTQVAKSRGPS